MTKALPILWDRTPTYKVAHDAARTMGERAALGKRRRCCHGGGLMTDKECRSRFAASDDLCLRGGLCSLGAALAKGEAA